MAFSLLSPKNEKRIPPFALATEDTLAATAVVLAAALVVTVPAVRTALDAVAGTLPPARGSGLLHADAGRSGGAYCAATAGSERQRTGQPGEADQRSPPGHTVGFLRPTISRCLLSAFILLLLLTGR